MTRPFPSVDALLAGLVAGDRTLIGRAVTLVESRHHDHRARAAELLARLPRRPTDALRVGITGAPGVGKSTFIDALGVRLTAAGHLVAVLAIDPSSERSGGSILGDKTRMARLAVDPRAFIRPSPSAGTLGGIAARTREAMLVLEAAGFDVILIETVGVGQSETAVRHLCDVFALLALAGAGDELQGIKRGIMELADVVIVTKADGDNVTPAARAAAQLRAALRLTRHGEVPVLTVSAAREPATLDPAWHAIVAHHDALAADGRLAALRSEQAVRWLWTIIDERLRERVRHHPDCAAIEAAVRAGTLPIESAAARLVDQSHEAR